MQKILQCEVYHAKKTKVPNANVTNKKVSMIKSSIMNCPLQKDKLRRVHHVMHNAKMTLVKCTMQKRPKTCNAKVSNKRISMAKSSITKYPIQKKNKEWFIM